MEREGGGVWPRRGRCPARRFSVVDYFKGLSKEADIPYQTLINFYLRDCVETHRKPKVNGRNPHCAAGSDTLPQ